MPPEVRSTQPALKPIGGEAPYAGDDAPVAYLTDSGRSSLRLIVRSGFARMRFLLPEFVCEVVPRTLDALNVRYAYYRVNDDLSIDRASIRDQEFDVLYIVHYFAQRQEYGDCLGEQQWVIEDCAFLPVVERPLGIDRWIGFNSFRKISHLADGSLLRSMAPLDPAQIEPGEAPFAVVKAHAKRLKWEYLHASRHSEADYLREFERGEAMLQAQTRIHAISASSLYQLLEFYRRLHTEYAARMRNYRLLESLLSNLGMVIRVEYPCMFVLDVERRDELRRYLRAQRIFLPVHWPNTGASDNRLYRRLLSIPVDARYAAADMRRIARNVMTFYGK